MNGRMNLTDADFGVTPGTAIDMPMSGYEQECLWELFAMPGWDLMEKRIRTFIGEYASKTLASARNSESDRYEIGRYDGIQELVEFMRAMVIDARPGA